MKLLAIDTATEACSAALLIDGRISTRYEVAPRAHARLILPMCEALLDEAGIGVRDLNALAYGRGPGAFTGVRIAAGIIQGVAYASDLPVVPVSTLATIASETMERYGCSRVISVIDARMEEVYWGCYEKHADGSLELNGAEHVGKPENVDRLVGADWFGAGSGWQAWGEQLAEATGLDEAHYDATLLPGAEYVVRLAERELAHGAPVSAAQALPVYLRDNVARKQADR